MLYLNDAQVASRLCVSRPTIWRWTRENPHFPKPVKLGAGCSRWLDSEIAAFEAAAIATRDSSIAA